MARSIVPIRGKTPWGQVFPSSIILQLPQKISDRNRPRAERRPPLLAASIGGAQLGIGGKSLLEDWIKMQYNTPPSHPDYRTGHFRIYPTYSLQFNFMYRYARRWASGLGLDLNYAQAAHHIAVLDRAAGVQLPHSPWSVGLAARHEVFLSQPLVSYVLRRLSPPPNGAGSQVGGKALL